MEDKNKCIVCGRLTEEGTLYCPDCKLEIEIKQFEMQIEM